MTNSYFNDSDIVTRLGQMRSIDINSFAAALILAFDLLPNPDNLATNMVGYAVATGAGGAYSATVTPFPGALAEGMRVRIKVNHTNPGGGVETLVLNAFASKPIRDNQGNVLIAGMMVVNSIVTMTYTTGYWQLDQIAAISIPQDESVTAAKLATADVANIVSKIGLFPKQSSASDATSSRLLIQGAHGLGANAPTAAAPETNNLYTGFMREGTSPGDDLTVRVSASTSEIMDLIGVPSTERLFFKGKSTTWKAAREIFHQASILGTVAQAGGVPTGAVIERGSNVNGRYVRFADGTQICTKALSGQGPISTALGNLFQSGNIDLGAWAAEFTGGVDFSNFKSSHTSAHSWASVVTVGDITSAGNIVVLRATTSAATDYIVSCFGIGRWF